jgi:uncharacterized protein (DUF2267 family)
MENSSPIAPEGDSSPAAAELLEAVRDIEQHAPIRPPITGADAFTAVMCAMAERLDETRLQEVVEILPPDLRGPVEDCAHRETNPPAPGESSFERIARDLQMDVASAEWTAAVVLEVVLQRLPYDAAERLAQLLPAELLHPRPYETSR